MPGLKDKVAIVRGAGQRDQDAGSLAGAKQFVGRPYEEAL
jgi:hypothetical protein